MGVSENGILGDLNQNNIIVLEDDAQSGACPLQDDIRDGCKENQGHGEKNIQIMKKSGESDENCVWSSGDETSIKCSSPTANVVLQNIQSHDISHFDEKYKKLTRKKVSIDKLWDGCLKLNSSITVSTVALFKRLFIYI